MLFRLDPRVINPETNCAAQLNFDFLRDPDAVDRRTVTTATISHEDPALLIRNHRVSPGDLGSSPRNIV